MQDSVAYIRHQMIDVKTHNEDAIMSKRGKRRRERKKERDREIRELFSPQFGSSFSHL